MVYKIYFHKLHKVTLLTTISGINKIRYYTKCIIGFLYKPYDVYYGTNYLVI